MSIEIITPRTRHEEVECFLSFKRLDDPSFGLIFPCDEVGTVGELTDMGLANLEEARHSGLYTAPQIVRNVNRWTEPAKARCHCGRFIYLEDPMDNECEHCGRNYNMAGQEVIPMSECRYHDDY